jgi:hypothetical protein
MRISQGLLSLIASTGDEEATRVLNAWKKEDTDRNAQNRAAQCYYFGDLDYFTLHVPKAEARHSTMQGMPISWAIDSYRVTPKE